MSLAVWMGGATSEFYRVLRHARSGGSDVYAGLLDLTRSAVSVDVVAGTSAGGINGAFLAFALANDLRSIEPLRNVWIDSASFETLLRPITDKSPASLLRGDEVLYGELVKALGLLLETPQSPETAAPSSDVTLIMTTTLLSGTQHRFPDGFGTDVFEVDHRGVLTFTTHGSGTSEALLVRGATASDHHSAILHRLALAARASASFPVAFEASFLPIQLADAPATSSPPRYDMGRAADFRDAGSQYAIDGGVLVNRPLAPLLDAISHKGADRKVRRVLALVVPDPARAVPPDPADVAQPPTLADVGIAAALTIPRNQSLRAELTEIEEHNRKTSDRSSIRRALVELDGPQIETLATAALPLYRERRTEHSVDTTIGRIYETRGMAARPTIDLEVVRRHLRIARKQLLPTALTFGERDDEPWRWGIATLQRMASTVIALTDDAYDALTSDEGEVAKELAEVKRETHTILSEVGAIRVDDDRHWLEQWQRLLAMGTNAGETDLDFWATEAYSQWPYGEEGGGKPRQRTVLLRELGYGRRIAARMLALEEIVARIPDDEQRGNRLTELRAVLATHVAEPTAAASSAAAIDATLRRLLAIEVIQFESGGDTNDERIELLQVSARTPDAFRYRIQVPDASMKLASVRLGHFAGFYRRAWRANDWMWGRLDGAARIVQILLEPRRLRQIYTSQGIQVAVRIRELAVGGRHEAWLAAAYDPVAIQRELDFLADPHRPLPARLPHAQAAILRRIQLDILDEELERIDEEAQQDEERGSSRTPGAARFRRAVEAVGTDDDRSKADKLIAAFEACRFGQETILDDAGSNYLTKLSAQTAGVAISATTGATAHLGALGKPLQAIRGAFVALYWMARGAAGAGSQPNTTYTALVIALFSLAGFFIAASVVLPSRPAWLAVAGVIALGFATSWVFVRWWGARAEIGGTRANAVIGGALLVIVVLAVLPFHIDRIGRDVVAVDAEVLNSPENRSLIATELDGVDPSDIEIIGVGSPPPWIEFVADNAPAFSGAVILLGMIGLGAWTARPARPRRKGRPETRQATVPPSARSIGWAVLHDYAGDRPVEVRIDKGTLLLVPDRDEATDTPEALGLTPEQVAAMRRSGGLTFDRDVVDNLTSGSRVAAADPEDIGPHHHGRWAWRVDGHHADVAVTRIKNGWLYPDERLLGALRTDPSAAAALDDIPLTDLRTTVPFGRTPTTSERLKSDPVALADEVEARLGGWTEKSWRLPAAEAADLIRLIDSGVAGSIDALTSNGDVANGRLLSDQLIQDWVSDVKSAATARR